MRSVVIDTETNALKDYDRCWVVVCRDLETNEVATFRHIHEVENARLLGQYLGAFGRIIGHNLIGFDLPVLHTFGVDPGLQSLDTLIVSRLINYNRKGGHSLETWGEHFKVPKSTFSDFSQWSQELEDRCIVDTLLTADLYRYLKRYIESPRWKEPIELEHRVATLCNTLSTNGFSFNVTSALELQKEISLKVEALSNSFREVFPPRPKLLKVVNPQKTKSGALHAKDFKWLETKDLTPFEADAPFSLFTFEEFNPNSPSQIVERLNAAGWKPVNKTKGHIEAERILSGRGTKEEKAKAKDDLERFKVSGWKVDEENLATLPEHAPEASRKLAEYILLNSRLGDLTEWIGLYRASTGRVHGVFNPIGSWTHRKSHNSPNMANIPALTNRKGLPQPYGPEFRSLWKASDGWKLIGTDAEGIQLRLFAHYCNDQRLIAAIATGRKEDKTDIHHLNIQVLDTICNSRDVAKTYIYALFLGASTGKQAEILGCTRKQAEEGFGRILEFYPGWKELKDNQLARDGERGFFEGLDGRLVVVPDAHRVLAGYLQNGESVVMKKASLLWTEQLDRLHIPYKFVNDVHDEWQTETLPRYADTVGQIQCEAIRRVGEELKLNCPLAGKYKIGNNWSQTH